MARSPDLLVLGDGVVALSCALEAARAGASVRVLGEGRPGASAAAAGMLCPSFEALHEGGRALMAMGRESLALWDGFAASLAEDPARDLGYDRSGVLGSGFPPGLLPGRSADVPPGIEASGGVLVPGEGQVEAGRLLAALRAACEAAGVAFEAGRGSVGGEGQVRRGDGERLPAARVLLASGIGAGHPALFPVRGRAFLVRAPGLRLPRVVRTPTVYLCPKPGELVYVGATEEERESPAAPDGLWHEACWLAPTLKGTEVVAWFDGIRPATRDGLPIVGKDPERPGVLLALGHYRNGILLAPYTARRIAGLL